MMGAVLAIVIGFAVGNASRGATNDVSALLQKGLLEEEANHNLEAAIQAYQAVVTQTEKERQFTATAVFRLGECYRKLGRTNEANVQYQRILKEFSDQTELAKLSRDYIGATTNTSFTSYAQLFTAENEAALAETREVARLQAMIKDSPDLINARDGAGVGATPLFKAARDGQLKVAAFLLDNKADIESRNGGYTPLMIAAERGNKEMVDLLLNRGADANAAGRANFNPAGANSHGGFTALHIAANFGYRAVAEALLAQGARVIAKTDMGLSPLHLAASGGFKSVAELLLAKGADPNAKDEQGVTPLMKAATAGNRAIVEWLLANKAEVNGKANNGWTALHSAIERADNETAKLLLENQADPNLMSTDRDASGRTPLMIAAGMRNTAGAELLLKHGASVNATNSNGYCALQAAINQNDEATAKLLLENKADPNIGADGYLSLLQSAVGRGQFQIAESMIAHGANVNYRNKLGQAPLHTAVQLAAQNPVTSKEMVEVLLSHGADVNAKDNDGNTPLDLFNSSASTPPRPGMAPSPVLPMVASPYPGAPPMSYQWRGLPSQTPQHSDAVALILREHGAVGETERSTIRVFRKGVNNDSPYVVFRRDSKLLNQYTLVEVVQRVFSSMGGMQFPDFTRVSVTHGNAGTTETKSPIAVDLMNGTNGFDCSKDRWLEFGDIVEIPEREHALSEQWNGLPDSQKGSLFGCGLKSIRVVVKGQSKEIRIGTGNYLGQVMNYQDVLKVLLSSSDLTRLKVSRTDPVTKKPVELTVNGREPNRGYEDLWVRDGDVIEVPDKQ